MKYVSLFSGIEAATVAWEPLGWKPVCFAEFDKFPSAVLAERYPEVPNIGDVTKMNWKKYRNKVDMVVGGSPCQSFSIAGKREGLQGESGLMFEYIRAVREIRPRWFLWENVPGALQARMGRLSDSSCPKWTSSGTAWRGAYSMRSSSEWPKDAAVSFLSDILEPAPPSAYSLSRRACGGILNRARKRGRALPKRLEEALAAQASSTTKGQAREE